MLFNVFLLVNTCHALGFNAFLMVDALTFFRCHLRATEMRLNARFSNCWNQQCSGGLCIFPRPLASLL